MIPLLKLIFAGNEENPTDLPCLQAFNKYLNKTD